jgi:hypothetical protein
MKKVVAVGVVVALAACGDDPIEPSSFEIVGHNDLGARGMSSALAIAGTTAYVGSRIDNQGVAIVDISDPANPTVVGELGTPDEALGGMSSRELRAVDDLNLLVILNLRCSPDLHGCGPGAAETENLKFYDITDRLHPRLVSTVQITGGTVLAKPSPHEFFLWRDPQDPARVVVYLAAPGPSAFWVFDVAAGAATELFRWDPIKMGGLTAGGTDNILHSVSISDDGRTGYLSHQTSGLVLVDLSAIVDRGTPAVAMVTPPAQALKFGIMGPHSAVPVPGKPLLFVTEEIYPAPFGAGCPWGHARLVDITDPTMPTIKGEVGIAENDPACTANAPMTAFTAHNATVTPNLALVTWYAGGLQAIDISNPAKPAQLAEVRPEPLVAVTVEDPGLGGNPVEMWSYPVIQDGIIWVVDVRNGLYALRYHGRFEDELTSLHFAEGNSNLH